MDLSESLKGVVIRGVIAMVLPAVTLGIELWKWRREKRLEHLKGERERLAALFDELSEKIVDAKLGGSYPVEMLAKISRRCPHEIGDAFTELRKEKDETRYNLHYLRLQQVMQKKLAEIDEKIEKAVP